MIVLFSFISGFLASLGVGGGTVLIVLLTAFMGYDRLSAQFMNLLFFLPVALVSAVIHIRSGLVDIKRLIPAVISGAVLSAAGVFAAYRIGSGFLGKIYSVFLIVFGIYNIFGKKTGEKKAAAEL